MIKISGKEIIKKTYTPVAALAPHGSLKFLALMTKIGEVNQPVTQGKATLATYGSVQHLRLRSKFDSDKAAEEMAKQSCHSCEGRLPS